AARSRSVLGAMGRLFTRIRSGPRGQRRAAPTSLTAEDFADRREEAVRFLFGSQCLTFGGDAAALGLFLPGGLGRLGRVLRRQRELAGIAVGALDGDVQQALLVEDEVHPLPRHLGRKLEGAEVLVVDDAVAVALEDVELEPPAVARRRQAEAALRRDLDVLLDHLAEAPAGHGKADRHAKASTSVTESISCIDSASSAAPSATDSSGWTPLRGGLPKNWCALPCTSGMRVCPPTS